MRITGGVFRDLAIWMVGFGLCIGVAFPFFVMTLGVSSATALTTVFFVACLGAGALAGAVNFGLSRWIVGHRLRVLADGMNHVESNLNVMTYDDDVSRCTPEECAIPADSDDEIGESAGAFNRLVITLSQSMRTQAAVRSFSAMLTSQLEIDGLAESALQQFFDHTGAMGGLILYESGGELLVAASRGLRDPETISASDHVMNALRTKQRQLITIPDDIRVESVIADFRPSEVIVSPISYKEVPPTAFGRSGSADRRLQPAIRSGAAG